METVHYIPLSTHCSANFLVISTLSLTCFMRCIHSPLSIPTHSQNVFLVLFLFTRTGSFYLCLSTAIAIAFVFVLNDKCCPGKKWFSIKFSCTPENDIFYCIYSSEQSYQQSFSCVCAVFCSFCFVFIETNLESPMCKYTFLRAIQYSVLAYGWISSNRLNIGIHTE